MALLLERLRAALAERFLVERELGRGGMATVYLAQDRKHDRAVALKVLYPELASVIGAERFFREIQIAARLNHPHILPLLDSGQADGLFYYVMPLMSGESLRDRLERERQLSVPEALRIANQIAAALGHAHRHGVIHRDIKPENILLHEGEVLVADFGIAFAVSGAGERLTETGLSLGTPQYMSPEQATGERVVDARSDVYALGCVTYEMLAGEPPFTGVTSQAIIAKLMTERPVRLRTLRDAVPVAVDEAVACALAKTPADRFAGAEEFAAALSAPAVIRRKRSNGRRLAVAGLVALSVVGLVGIGRLLTGRSRALTTPAARLQQITFTGDANEVALSPDGKSIAYLAEGMTSLVLQDLGGGGRVTVIHDSALKALRWSPDGTRLLYGTGTWFCICQSSHSRLYLLPRLGGEPIALSPPEATPMSSSWAFDFGGNDSTVLVGFTTANGNNKWIYLGADPASIRTISDDSVTAQGRVLRLAGPLDGERVLHRVRLSPDGRWIAFTAGLLDRLVGTISVHGGGLNILMKDSAAGGTGYGLEWAPLGDALYVSRVEGASGAILRIGVDPRTGAARGKAEPVLSNLAAPSQLGLSADGRRLALGSGLDRIHLLLVRLGLPGGAEPVTTPISCGTATCASGALSPDGRFLAYLQSATSVATKWDLYVRPAGSGPERRLATDFVFAGSPSWSPDGRQIAYFRYGGDSSTLLVMDVATARSREAWRGPWGTNWAGGASWAADSRQLGFWSARGLVVLTDTVERLISRDTTHSLSFPVFSPDGRHVVVHHLGPEGKGLWLVDLVSGAEARLLTGDGIIPIKWREDGNIYFLRSDSSLAAITLEVIRAAGGSVRVAGVFPRSSYDLQCDVSFLSLTSDLRTAVCSEAQSNSDIWVVDNFDQARR